MTGQLESEVNLGNKRVAITGLGGVTCVAENMDSLVLALQNPVRRIGPSRRHEVSFDIVVGEADATWFADVDTPFDSETGRLSLSAARACVRDAASRGAALPDGLVFGTSTGGQAENERVVFDILNGRAPSTYDYRRRGCMAAPTRLIASDLDIVGPVRTVSTACTSGANAIALGMFWIQSGKCRRVLAGGGDALCGTTLSSFHILELTGATPCTPFGADRPGLTLADGAGFLMLEALDDVISRGQTPLAEIIGVGMSSDAHHMTAPPPDGAGAALAMTRAVEKAGISPTDVSYINAHGTGTLLNDAAEATAIREVFGDTPVMSAKGLLGHTLGGAGGIEAVVSVLSICHRHAYENVGARAPAEDCPVVLIGEGGLDLPEVPVVLSTSFAFGGNNCVLVFKGIEER